MSDATTVIPVATRVSGLVETPGDLLVEGRCEGTIELGGTLTVAAGASCQARVRALAAIIRGELIGDAICSQSIEVAAGARVVGDLRAPDIAVSAAAEVDGRVDLLPPAPAEAEVTRVRLSTRGPRPRRPIAPAPTGAPTSPPGDR